MRSSVIDQALKRCISGEKGILELSYIDLSTALDGDIEYLANFISSTPDLREINAKACSLGRCSEKTLTHLFLAISRRTNLKLNLYSNFTEDSKKSSALVARILATSKIISLDIERNPGLAEHLATILQNTFLKVLNCQDCQFSSFLTPELLSEWGHAIAEHPALTYFNITFNNLVELTNESLSKLFSAVNYCKTLNILKLASNGFGDLDNPTELLPLFEDLLSNPHLKTFDISENSLPQEFMEELFKLIRANSSITQLSYTGNSYKGDIDMKAILNDHALSSAALFPRDTTRALRSVEVEAEAKPAAAATAAPIKLGMS